jgi:hypothetical protein
LKYEYPPDDAVAATDLVMEQAEAIASLVAEEKENE